MKVGYSEKGNSPAVPAEGGQSPSPLSAGGAAVASGPGPCHSHHSRCLKTGIPAFIKISIYAFNIIKPFCEFF